MTPKAVAMTTTRKAPPTPVNTPLKEGTTSINRRAKSPKAATKVAETPKPSKNPKAPPAQPEVTPEVKYNTLCQRLRGRTGNVLALCTNIDRSHVGKVSVLQLQNVLTAVDTTLSPFDVQTLTQRYGASTEPVDYIEFVGGIILQDAPSFVAPKKQVMPLRLDVEEIVSSDKAESDKVETLRSTMRRMLSEEFAAVTKGGGQGSLLTPFVKMDIAKCGYLSQANLRRGIVRLFRECDNRPVPKWLLERCCKIAKMPFGGGDAMEATTPIETAARRAAGEIRQEYPKEDLADYRFLFVYLQLLPHTVLPYATRT